jgi:hypothetical protein
VSDLPPWFRLTVLGTLLALLVFNVLRSGDSTLSLAIVGGLFGAIALDRNAHNNSNKGGRE